MHKIILYIGDVGEYLAELAGPDSQLLTERNYNYVKRNYRKFLSTSVTGIFHSSFADLGGMTDSDFSIYDVLQWADEIRYFPPEKWSDSEEFSWPNTKTTTEFFLTTINNSKNNVIGLPDSFDICDKYLKLQSERTSNSPAVFVSGCSCSYGIGVDQEQTFGYLVSKEFNRELVMTALPGSDLAYGRDQILRSDIQKDDIVIWGLTHELRKNTWEGDGLTYTVYDYKAFEENSVYLSVVSVFQVINFCRKIGARLILLPVICSEAFRLGLKHLPEFLNVPYHRYNPNFLDFGSDDLHPGPGQHKEWAELILAECNH